MNTPDLNELYPLYTPPPETLDDYINLILDNLSWWIEPLMIGAVFATIVWLRVKKKA